MNWNDFQRLRWQKMKKFFQRIKFQKSLSSRENLLCSTVVFAKNCSKILRHLQNTKSYQAEKYHTREAKDSKLFGATCFTLALSSIEISAENCKFLKLLILSKKTTGPNKLKISMRLRDM